MARLGDICEILDSMRVPITASDRKPGPYPYYGANGVQDYVADYIFDDELVLLAEDGGNFGSKDKPIAYRVSGKCWVNNHAHVLKPKEGVDVDYLCYSLMFYDVTGLVNGATRKKLTQADMRKIEILLPPIDEQRKIAAVLDKISDLTAKRRRQLDKLDELVKSRFMEQFGDYNADTPLGKICTQRPQNGFYRKGSEIDGNIPIVKMKQLFGVESMEKATDCDLVAMTETERKKFRLTSQDLLFGRRSLVLDGAGKCRRAGNITGEMVFESSLLRVSLDEAVMRPRFLQHWFDTDDGINAIIAIRSVTTIAGIKGSDLACVKVPVPPIQLQDKFLDFVTQIDKIQSTIQCSLSTIDTLKKSLMQEYFSVR